MSYAIVYSSRTGNTELLARAIQSALPAEDCLYFGGPDAAALAADRLYVGFWTDKGSCDEALAAFLATVEHKEVFLFGTAGLGSQPAYFQAVLKRVQANLARAAPWWAATCARARCPRRCAGATRRCWPPRTTPPIWRP